MHGRFKIIFVVIVVVVMALPSVGISARIKDIASIKGSRTNQLFGYGLVIGLNATGDTSGTGFTIQGLVNMLEKMSIHVSPNDVEVKNVAAVIVSASLPAFAKIGQRLDITISSIGDASSLQGGTLLLTSLKGVDRKVYALAQGAIAVGGYSIGGDTGGGAVKNHPTVGIISGGATVEKEIPVLLADKKKLTILLNSPDFMTADRIAAAINAEFGAGSVIPVDSGTLNLKVPESYRGRIVGMIAKLGNLSVTPDSIAKVIVNEKTGTVVIGENVRISTVAIAHGNLTIQVKESKNVSQPGPLGTVQRLENAAQAAPVQMDKGVVVAPGGATVVTPDTDIAIQEEKNRLLLIPSGRTVGELVQALNAIGVTPRDLITILQTIKAAGALQARLEII